MKGEGGAGSELRERVFRFACSVMEMHRWLWRNEPSLRHASSQASSAATSIGANLEEADAAQSRADFISKCSISLKEARESRYWLRILNRILQQESISLLIHESTELIAILTTIIKRTREKR